MQIFLLYILKNEEKFEEKMPYTIADENSTKNIKTGNQLINILNLEIKN